MSVDDGRERPSNVYGCKKLIGNVASVAVCLFILTQWRTARCQCSAEFVRSFASYDSWETCKADIRLI